MAASELQAVLRGMLFIRWFRRNGRTDLALVWPNLVNSAFQPTLLAKEMMVGDQKAQQNIEEHELCSWDMAGSEEKWHPRSRLIQGQEGHALGSS